MGLTVAHEVTTESKVNLILKPYFSLQNLPLVWFEVVSAVVSWHHSHCRVDD